MSEESEDLRNQVRAAYRGKKKEVVRAVQHDVARQRRWCKVPTEKKKTEKMQPEAPPEAASATTTTMRNPSTDDGRSRLGEDTMEYDSSESSSSRTRQCCDGGEESEEVFPKSRWSQALMQYLELKHRTKLKSPSSEEKFLSNIVYERKNNQSHQQPVVVRNRLRPAKLAWAAMASVLLFSVLIVAPPGSAGNEIRPSQAQRPLKRGGEYTIWENVG